VGVHPSGSSSRGPRAAAGPAAPACGAHGLRPPPLRRRPPPPRPQMLEVEDASLPLERRISTMKEVHEAAGFGKLVKESSKIEVRRPAQEGGFTPPPAVQRGLESMGGAAAQAQARGAAFGRVAQRLRLGGPACRCPPAPLLSPLMAPSAALPAPAARQVIPRTVRLLLAEFPGDGDLASSASLLDQVRAFKDDGMTKHKSLRRAAAEALGDVSGAGRGGGLSFGGSRPCPWRCSPGRALALRAATPWLRARQMSHYRTHLLAMEGAGLFCASGIERLLKGLLPRFK
jgi:hypothetical protein